MSREEAAAKLTAVSVIAHADLVAQIKSAEWRGSWGDWSYWLVGGEIRRMKNR